MDELAPAAAPAAPVDRRDAWTKFRSYLGTIRTLVDRRAFWAREEREIVGYQGLRRGEISARRTFWRLLRRGVDPVAALREALGLNVGPIPELHTLEQFDEIWTDREVRTIAARWAASARTQRCAAPPVTGAISMLEDTAPEMAAVLITTARNPAVKDADRRQAARDALILAGVKVDPSKPTFTPNPIVITGKETVEELEILLIRVPQEFKDTNQARLITEAILNTLAAKDPKKWGKRLTVENTGSIGLGAILVQMDERREAAIAEHRAKQGAIETTAKPLLSESDE